jgi:hypothetical protein
MDTTTVAPWVREYLNSVAPGLDPRVAGALAIGLVWLLTQLLKAVLGTVAKSKDRVAAFVEQHRKGLYPLAGIVAGLVLSGGHWLGALFGAAGYGIAETVKSVGSYGGTQLGLKKTKVLLLVTGALLCLAGPRAARAETNDLLKAASSPEYQGVKPTTWRDHFSLGVVGVARRPLADQHDFAVSVGPSAAWAWNDHLATSVRATREFRSNAWHGEAAVSLRIF